jgi:hypothetical protein
VQTVSPSPMLTMSAEKAATRMAKIPIVADTSKLTTGIPADDNELAVHGAVVSTVVNAAAGGRLGRNRGGRSDNTIADGSREIKRRRESSLGSGNVVGQSSK